MARASGFALLTPEQRKESGKRGGAASAKSGRGHRFVAGTDEVRIAAIAGGYKVSRDKEYMREIGRKGAATTNAKRRQQDKGN